MRFTTLVVACMLAAVLGSGTAEARSASKTYDGPMMLVCCPSVSFPKSLDSDGSLELGGATFATVAGETRAAIMVHDASGLSVDVLVCQDTNGDGSCGGAGEPSLTFCSDDAAHSLDIQGGKTLFVYVQALDPILAGCDFTAATHGSIDVSFA
ncbi:MAG: hypothetical protein ACYDCK_05575 [Thermoplasmatota archaeon]